MPGRQYTGATGYRYGFNGKESDDEVKGIDNSYDFGARIYDPRIGKFLSVDPMAHEREWLSPYNFVQNNPISRVDPTGALDDDVRINTETKEVIINPTDDKVDRIFVNGTYAGTQEKGKSAPKLEAQGFKVTQGHKIEGVGMAATDMGIAVVAGVGVLKSLIDNVSSSTPKLEKPNANQIKSKSEGTQGGNRAGKPFTPKGKKEVWQENTNANSGKPKCENCELDLQKPPKSEKGVPTPSNAGQVDHIWPQSKGGDGAPSNGQLLCPSCNVTKSDNLPIPKTSPYAPQ